MAGVRASKIEELKNVMEALTTEKLELLVDFASYLKSKEEWDATHELLADPGMARDLSEGRRQAEKGEGRSWRDVKRAV